MAVTYKEYRCKGMLRMHKYTDNWFWTSGFVSPYRACEHACNYCDGRSERYHASEDFDQLIHVKINAPEVLKKELDRLFPRQKSLSEFGNDKAKKARKLKPVIGISSGISDAYQPAERRYVLTRKMLELMREYEVPIHIMTKSDLVLRDLDILKEINEKAWCTVSFSVSTMDKKLACLFEPRASPPEKRIEAMRTITSKGILAGVTYIPIIPYITDSENQLEETIKASKKHDAGYILAGTMTLRDLQAKRFYEILDMHFPDLVEKYRTLYRSGYEPNQDYMTHFYHKIKKLCKKHDTQNYIPRYIPDMELKKNIQTSTMLFLISYFLSIEGENRFRVETYRRLAQTIENMDKNIEDIYKAGKLGDIKGMGKKTERLIKEFLETGKCGYLEELKG